MFLKTRQLKGYFFKKLSPKLINQPKLQFNLAFTKL